LPSSTNDKIEMTHRHKKQEILSSVYNNMTLLKL